jgi:hypothetical protein
MDIKKALGITAKSAADSLFDRLEHPLEQKPLEQKP